MFANTPPAAAWKDSLNPAQREAVTAGDGPTLVIAGAGTGKTWTLACRVGYLIEQGIPPERILLLTFSRRAAREMLQRAGRLVSQTRAGKVWGGTFHAIGNRLLRVYGRPLGLPPDFTVLDQADMADLMDLIRGEQHWSQTKKRFPKKDTLAAIYSRMVNAGEPLSAVLERAFPWCRDEADGIRAIFAEYTRRKRAQNVLDYDDLLLYWRAAAETSAGKQMARQFEHVLVDEYQDTNPLQAHILQSLRAENRNLMVVGDDAQAIYGFRAASVRNILDFPVHFPGARRITLEQNYRSTRPILDVSNAVIARARERFEKNLWPVRPGGARPVLWTCLDENEQANQVCDQILEHREQGVPLRAQSVLFRTGHHSDLLELELTRRNIPFVKYGGLKFLESAHIKDILAVLRILENPRDEVSWFRVLQLLEGIGPATARTIMQSLHIRAPAPALQRPLATRDEAVGPPEHTQRAIPQEADPPPPRRAPAAAPQPALQGIPQEPGPPDQPRHAFAPQHPLHAIAQEPGPPDPPQPALAPQHALPDTALHGITHAAGALAPAEHALAAQHALPDSPPPAIPAQDPLRLLLDAAPRVPDPAQAGLQALREALQDCVSAQPPLGPASEIARVRRFYDPILQERYSSAQARLQDLEQLEHVASAYPARGRFLSELALDPPNSTSDLAGPPLLDEDYLILSTIHSAKGGEWDVVHVIHAADGMIPSDMSTSNQDEIEEERRLFYVALTRARDDLHVYFPLRFYRRPRGLDDDHHFAQLTRFLPEDIQSLFDRRDISPPPEPSPPVLPRASVDSLLSALWEA